MNSLVLRAVFCLLAPTTVYADLTLPHFFSDHMVLQRDRDARVWGTSSPSAEVMITFKGHSTKCVADNDGHWQATVATGAADATGATLEVASAQERVTIQDVLVGEVWFASGQSNMGFTLNRATGSAEVTAKANHPLIRTFNAPTVTAATPQSDIEGQWTLCSPETAPGYSAVAFFFARKLHEELGIPIGVIKSAWGGKPVETFTSREALQTMPATKTLVDQMMRADSEFDATKAEADYKERLEQWNAALAQSRATPAEKRKRSAKKPAQPKRPILTEGQPGVLYDAMIHPFVGYTMRGAIWYQGEANSRPGAIPYDQTLPLMIRDWRTRWNDDFSFYFVQLANYHEPSTEPGTQDSWALTQDRMRMILQTTSKTGMAVINDVGDAKDIHPKDKQSPGERLARWALAKDYGRDVIASGPLFQSHEVRGDAIHVKFDYVANGLKSRDGEPLKRFEIAGEDRQWQWAEATIESPDTIAVRCASLTKPVAVRYAWAANPEGANLVNSEGLPTSIFRTDDWDDESSDVERAASELLKRRRELASQIKANNELRQTLDRSTEEYRELVKKHKKLLEDFQATAR